MTLWDTDPKSEPATKATRYICIPIRGPGSQAMWSFCRMAERSTQTRGAGFYPLRPSRTGLSVSQCLAVLWGSPLPGELEQSLERSLGP